ncbi:MAG: hypothetical protein WC400_03725, partial [Patescibacteria group bacterium]
YTPKIIMKNTELEIVEQEDEMMSNEALNLAADLSSTVAYGESLGVFTPKEAMDWYVGIDDCHKVSHLRGLIPYLNKFIASGEARLRQLERAADSDLLTAAEQRGYINEADGITYHAKGQLIVEIKNLVARLESLRTRLLSILNQKKIRSDEKSALINKFYSASANSKDSVISEAENIRIVEEPAETIVEKSATTSDQPKTKLELAEPTSPLKDPKAECLNLVELYLRHDQFSQAADLVEASNYHFNLAEYRALLKRIEKVRVAKEIPDLRAWLKAA